MRKFDSFIVLAGMRTGSNFLEECLNEYDGLRCFGEAFNPHFVGHAKQTELLGVSIQQREQDPISLLNRMKTAGTDIPGFRFFFDHDPRVLEACLRDPKCGKVILNRNPVDAFVSLEIARKTGQWRLGDSRKGKTAMIEFSQPDFDTYLSEQQGFREKIAKTLQSTGQCGFYLNYDDIGDIDVLNGLAAFLGSVETRDTVSDRTKKQNPSALEDKVSNYAEMVSSLSRQDYFDLVNRAMLDTKRGPAVKFYVASAAAPLIYMPIRPGPDEDVLNWLSDFGSGEEEALLRGFNQKSLRQWKRGTKGHRSFTVVRHPVSRLYSAFQTHILQPGPQNFHKIRETLAEVHGVPLATEDDPAQCRDAFLAFAKFVKANLNGLTSIRVDPSWASQSDLLRGMSEFMLPDHVLRENDLEQSLANLAKMLGLPDNPFVTSQQNHKVPLAEIYDDEIEAAVRAAYQKDYMMFGFAAWGSDRA